MRCNEVRGSQRLLRWARVVYYTHMNPLYILLVIIVLAALWFIATYNGFIRLRQRTEEAEIAIDEQQKHRHDRIPNLSYAEKG